MPSTMNPLSHLYITTWDILLTLVNLCTPALKEGSVVPHGKPGAGGSWPEYILPKEGDSRCSCPALNALANHGILPRDGKNITFVQMTQAVRESYNCAPSFCQFVPTYAANMLGKSYEKDIFDLGDLDLHNGIEHDASLTREDTKLQPSQSTPHVPFITELLQAASGKSQDGKTILTVEDVSRFSAKRRTDARATNPDFSLSLSHGVFGSSNTSTLLSIFGGRVQDLESILVEERLPAGWEPRVRNRLGLTLVEHNGTTLKVEFKTRNEQKKLDSKRSD